MSEPADKAIDELLKQYLAKHAKQQPAQATPEPSGSDGILDWALKEYLGVKIQRQHIANQAGANLVYNHGRNMEKQLGLASSGITPFPAPVSLHVQQPAAEPKKTPVWQQLALGGAMLGAGAALGPIGSMAVSALGNLIGTPQQAVPSSPGTGDVGIRIE